MIMIDPRDLRIGNKVKVTIGNDAGIYEVLGIPMWGMDGWGDGENPEVLIDRCPKQLVPPNKLKPIKLTDEILIKYGFQKGCLILELNEYWFLGYDTQLYLQVERQPEGKYIIERIPFPNIKHLHQLQNLYFALTGNELEIQL